MSQDTLKMVEKAREQLAAPTTSLEKMEESEESIKDDEEKSNKDGNEESN